MQTLFQTAQWKREGSVSGSIPLTTGFGSGRPKNMWIQIRLWIPNTVPDLFLFRGHEPDPNLGFSCATTVFLLTFLKFSLETIAMARKSETLNFNVNNVYCTIEQIMVNICGYLNKYWLQSADHISLKFGFGKSGCTSRNNNNGSNYNANYTKISPLLI